jgi:hypothetical protein
MAQLAKTLYQLPEITYDSKDWREGCKNHEAAFEALCEAGNKVDIDNGKVVGLVVSFPYADGAASYLVVKESPLTLQSIPYSDAWQLPYSHIRGLRKQDIIENARRHRGIKSMFGCV